MQATTAKPYLPSIKFLLDSPVEMFNDQQISVEPRNHSNSSYINTSLRKLPTLSLNIPSPNVSPVERNIDSMSGYHHKGNQYQNSLPRLPSISAIGQIESGLNKSVLNNNRDIVQKPNSIQSLLSPPESPDMANNPSFNDYETHHNHVAAEQQQQRQQQQQHQQQQQQQQQHHQQQHQQQQQQQQQQHQQHSQQQRPRLVQPEFHYSKTTSPVYSSNVAPLLTPHYQSYAAQSYVHPEQRGYDRVGGYNQEHVAYDHAYVEQHRAYPTSNTSPTTLQPAFSPYDSRPTTAPSTLPRLDNGGITRRYSTPITTKIMNDQLTSPITGGSSSNNHNNRYQCPYCSKRFSRPSSLRIHTYSHTGEKPFVCTEPGCGRKFSVQSNMRRHLRVHRLGRPVKKVRYDGEVEGVKMLNHGAVMRNC